MTTTSEIAKSVVASLKETETYGDDFIDTVDGRLTDVINAVLKALRDRELIDASVLADQSEPYALRNPDVARVGGNSGHGWAWSRPDGAVARCGGPMMCTNCAEDALLVDEAAR